jgi:uncharacterized protein (TIGR03067 family)
MNVLFALLTITMTVADDAKDKGSWDVVAVEARGMRTDMTKLKQVLTFKDGIITSKSSGRLQTLADMFTIDPTKKPKVLDCSVKGQEGPVLYIYQIDGDELKLAHPHPESLAQPKPEEFRRPESFETKDKPVRVMIAKRVKIN